MLCQYIYLRFGRSQPQALDGELTVLPLAFPCKIFFLLSGVLATQLNLQYTEDSQHFIAEAINGVRELFRSNSSEMGYLTLVGSSAAVPEDSPLQAFTSLEFVGESESVVLVCHFEKIEELGRGLHDGEGRRLVVVDQNRDAA